MAEDKISDDFFTQNMSILSKIARENCRFSATWAKRTS